MTPFSGMNNQKDRVVSTEIRKAQGETYLVGN